ncbi:histidine phosphatase family protein [Arthrobacter cryoconiti]|uniref:Histidine phosphatase family protein n=1 Tax=Arthrobacter cryoconiti TaxID=748907 RepID=A0ABV8R3C3_9MICC|nr:histidine phosphatase family protein [Arthrobacter cryoconiti]MCC9068521.1 histidine phosphatase family protein [Arthrobacter cryoconiti]
MTDQAIPTSSTMIPAGLPRRVIFWRHGRTAWNASGRFQGQSDVPLDDVGIGQAERAASLLAGRMASSPGERSLTLVSSDLTRALDTARALARLTGVEPAVDSRLRETYGGTWQGLTFAEIEQRYPAQTTPWQLDEPQARAGGGETRVEVAVRMVAAILDAVAKVPPGGTLVVTTHGGSTRVALAKLLGLPEHLWRTLSGLSNCHWSVVEQFQPVDAAPEDWLWRLLEHNVGTLPEPFEIPEDQAPLVED